MFNVEKAKKAGYSESEIMETLSSQYNFNSAKAMESGYSESEIVDLLAKRPAPMSPELPPMGVPGADVPFEEPLTQYMADPYERQIVDKTIAPKTALEFAGGVIEGLSPEQSFPAFAKGLGGLTRMVEEADLGQNPALNEFSRLKAERGDKSFTLTLPDLGREAGIYWDKALRKVEPKDLKHGTARARGFGTGRSIGTNTPYLIAGAVMRKPSLAIEGMAGQVTGEKFHDLREQGFGKRDSYLYSGIYGRAEAEGERFTVKALLNPALNFTRRVVYSTLADIPGELVTDIIQAGVDTQTIDPDMTWDEFGDRLYETGIQTALTGPIQAGVVHPVVGSIGKIEQHFQNNKITQEDIDKAKREIRASKDLTEDQKSKLMDAINSVPEKRDVIEGNIEKAKEETPVTPEVAPTLPPTEPTPPKKEVVPRGTKPVKKVTENGEKEKEAYRAEIEVAEKEELLKTEREAQKPEELTRKSVEKEKIVFKEKVAKLSESQKTTLQRIKKEVTEGTAGRRIPVEEDPSATYDPDAPKFISEPSTFPLYFQDKGYTKKETLRAIELAEKDWPLGKKQIKIIEDLILDARMQEAIEIEKITPAKEAVVTGELPKKKPFGEERGAVELGVVAEVPSMAKKAYKAVKEFFTPFSTIPQAKAYEELRYKTLGKLDRVEGTISKIWKRTKDLPSEQKKQLFDFLAGRIEKTTLPIRLQPLGVSLRTQHNLVGKMLVKRGLMTEKTYEENKDSYIKFMYLKHLEGGVKGGGRGLKLGLSYQKGRMDPVVKETSEGFQVVSKGGHKYSKVNLTKAGAEKRLETVQLEVDEYRRSIGLIEDISVAAPTGLASTLSDITKFDFMQEMSMNPDWVWQDSIVKVNGKRMGIGKLKEEIETQKKIVEQAPNVPEAQKRLEAMEKAMAEVVTDKAPEDFVQLPVAKAYGDLSGAYIRKEIALDIQPVVRMFSDSTQFGKIVNAGLKAEEQLVAAFKVGKVALNPPTIARNILSNQIQLNMSGIPLHKLPMYWGKAAKAMKDKSQYYNEARRRGIFRTNWALTEINEVLDTVKTMEKDGYAGILGSLGKLAKFYGKIDDFFKLLKYIEQREGGASKGTASREAQKWVMDYSRATPSIKFARKHMLPMVTFQYKIMPLIAESLAKRPWVIAKYMMIPYLMQEMAKQNLDIDDEEWEKLEKQLPQYVRESGVYTLYPVRSPEGNLQWVNLEYYVPWQGIIGLNQMVEKGDYGEAIGDVVRHPILDVITSFKTAKGEDPPKDTFTGREIYNRLDTPETKALKTTEWLISKWAPSAFTRRGAAHKSLQVAFPEHFGAVDDYGRKITKSQAAGKWVGFNIVSPTPKQVGLEKRRRIKEIDRAIFKVVIKPTSSKEYVKQIREAGKREKEKIRQYYGKGD